MRVLLLAIPLLLLACTKPCEEQRPADESKLWQVCWKSEYTSAFGCGEPLSYDAAMDVARRGNDAKLGIRYHIKQAK